MNLAQIMDLADESDVKEKIKAHWDGDLLFKKYSVGKHFIDVKENKIPVEGEDDIINYIFKVGGVRGSTARDTKAEAIKTFYSLQEGLKKVN